MWWGRAWILFVQERPHTNEERERLYQEGLEHGRSFAGTCVPAKAARNLLTRLKI